MTMLEDKKGKYLVGKLKDFENEKGWFFGHFADEDLLNSNLVEAAWKKLSRKNIGNKHSHKSCVEIVIVISGWIKSVIDGKKVKLKKGDFSVIYPHVIEETLDIGKDTELIVIKAPSRKDNKFSV